MKKYGKMNSSMTSKATSGQRSAKSLERKIADLKYAIGVYESRDDVIQAATARVLLENAEAEYAELFS
jgi:hypothetical protein